MAVPPAWIRGGFGAPVAFARRAAAAAGAGVGLQRRGARGRRTERLSGTVVPRSPISRSGRPHGRPGRAPRVGRPALGTPMVAAPSCARNYSARAPRPAASRCGSVAIGAESRAAEPSGRRREALAEAPDS